MLTINRFNLNYGYTDDKLSEFFITKFDTFRNKNILPIKLKYIKEKDREIVNYYYSKLDTILPSLNFLYDFNIIIYIKIDSDRMNILYDEYKEYNINENKREKKNFSIITKHLINRYDNIKFGYFVLCLIYSLFNTFNNMIIRGGFVRDLFLNKAKNDYKVDLDIYISDLNLRSLIFNLNHSSYEFNIYIKTIIDPIVNNLFRLIFEISINIESIVFFKVKTYANQSLNCISYKYTHEEIELSIDINYKGYHVFCNSDYKIYNMDYEQNGLELTYNKDNINSDIECKIFRNHENTTPYIKKKIKQINTNILINKILDIHLYNKFLQKEFIKKICEYLGKENIYLLKIIYTITKRTMYASHTLCTSVHNLCDDSSKYVCHCSKCFSIYTKMKSRHLKFSENFNVDSYKCKKKYCVCSAIHDDHYIIDNNYIISLYQKYQFTVSYNTFATNFCISRMIPTSIINFNLEHLLDNNKLDKNILQYNTFDTGNFNTQKIYCDYGSYVIIYKKKKLDKKSYLLNILANKQKILIKLKF